MKGTVSTANCEHLRLEKNEFGNVVIDPQKGAIVNAVA